MCKPVLFLFFIVSYGMGIRENFIKEHFVLSSTIVNALRDSDFDNELTFDLKKENQVHLNRTLSTLIKYIVKREVDNFRQQRPDAMNRKTYSAHIMKIIDIARDLPRDLSVKQRVEHAHHYYMGVQDRYKHDDIADKQVFHACARVYDILLTAPKIISALGNLDQLTPRTLVNKLELIQVKPIHLGTLLLIQYYLRQTINYAIKNDVLKTLSVNPKTVGPYLLPVLKDLATLLLPVVELLDIHLSHASPIFRSTCAPTWLQITKHIQEPSESFNITRKSKQSVKAANNLTQVDEIEFGSQAFKRFLS